MNTRALPLYATAVIFLLAYLLCWLQFPNILSTRVIGNLLTDNAYLGIVAVGMTLVILSGGIDLSVGSVIAFSGVFIAVILRETSLHPLVVFALLLALTTAFGAAMGFLIDRLAMPAFIVTLAMLIVLRGMLVGATRGSTLFDMPQPFFALASSTLLGLPWSVWLAALVFAAAGVMLRYHRLGRAVYAIGGNAPAARAAGINVDRVTWGVFTLAGTLAALGGLILTGYVGAINANQGNGMIFTVFAAAVIGGVSLDGGKGGMFGALCGVLLLGMVQNLLTLAQVPSFWIQAIYGAIILGALMVAKLTGENQQ